MLIGMLGNPGSGKTYIAQKICEYSKSQGNDSPIFVHLNSDFFRHTLFEDAQHSLDENIVIFQAMNVATEALLEQGMSVIFDANSNKLIHRMGFYELAKKHNAEYLTLYVKDNISNSLERNERRKDNTSKHFNYAPEHAVHHLSKEQELPTEDWEETVVIDRTQEREVDIEKIFRMIM